MSELDLDIDFNNVQSDILDKPSKAHSDVFQQDVQHVNWREDIDHSSVDGEGEGKFQSWADKLGGTIDTIKTYGANKEGKSYGEVLEGQGSSTQKPMEVRILGMKPLVFTLVALGVVIASGIAIAKIGTKASAK